MLEHEHLVEADFQQFYHLDYRDVYRDNGGTSRMTWRRCLSLAEQLPMESRFKSELEDRYPMDYPAMQLFRLEQVFTGKQSPLWDMRRKQRDEFEHRQALLAKREMARAHNAKYLARREKEGT